MHPNHTRPPVSLLWINLCVLLCGLSVFSVTLLDGFIGDDFVYVKRFSDLPWSRWPQLFTHDWSEGIWGIPLKELRPFAALSFMVDARLWGGNPLGWRATNLLLCLGSASLVMRLTCHYFPARPIAALLAGLVFILHPIQVEPVTWITGRVDLLGTFAALIFWLLAERYIATARVWQVGLAGFALVVGVFSKEFCLLAPILLVISWVVISPSVDPAPWRRRLVVMGVVVFVLTLYFWCRLEAFGSSSEQAKSLVQIGIWQRQASYAGWLLPWLPFKSMWEFRPENENLIKTVWIGTAVVTTLAAGWLRWQRRTQPATMLFFGLIWCLIAAGSLTAVGYFSPRHLHFASAGFAIAVGIGLTAFPHRRLAVVAALAVIAWFFSAHLAAIKPWRDNGELSQRALALAQATLDRAPADAVLAVDAPGILHHAWFWSWSGPQLAGAPFLRPGLPPEKVLCSEGIYFRTDWSDRARSDYALALANTSTLILLGISHDGVLTCHTLSGTMLSSATTRFAELAVDGLTQGEWQQWFTEFARSP